MSSLNSAASATQRWIFEVRSDLATGVQVTRIRRPGGAWQTPAQVPEHVRAYLGLRSADDPTMDGIDSVSALAALDGVRVAGRAAFVFATDIPCPPQPIRPAKARGKHAIRSLDDLLAHFSSETVPGAMRAIYRSTECGASLSIYGTYEGRSGAIHSPGREITFQYDLNTRLAPASISLPTDGSLPAAFVPDSFTVQTIVEGSDVTVDSESFYFGYCTTTQLDAWMREMEAQASYYWKRDNLSLYLVRSIREADEYGDPSIVECGWGDFTWDSDATPQPIRDAFVAWFEALEDEPEEGDEVTLSEGDLTITRLDRGSESYF